MREPNAMGIGKSAALFVVPGLVSIGAEARRFEGVRPHAPQDEGL